MKQLKSRVAAVTGAGSGIGRALAIELAGRGSHLALSDSGVSATTVHPGGIKTNIARNARVDDSVTEVAGDAEAARRRFDKALITTPERAARQILNAVERDRRRVLVGPDAKVIDAFSRLPAGVTQRVIAASAQLHRR